jgi:hypothetical protein
MRLKESQMLFARIFRGVLLKIKAILWFSYGVFYGCASGGLVGIRLCWLGFGVSGWCFVVAKIVVVEWRGGLHRKWAHGFWGGTVGNAKYGGPSAARRTVRLSAASVGLTA